MHTHVWERSAERSATPDNRNDPDVPPLKLQLYMWSGTRELVLGRHRFYVEQVRKKVFDQFRDIEREAEAFADEAHEQMGRWVGEDGDPADHAHSALDAGIERYGLLHDLRRQVTLGALAGCITNGKRSFDTSSNGSWRTIQLSRTPGGSHGDAVSTLSMTS